MDRRRFFGVVATAIGGLAFWRYKPKIVIPTPIPAAGGGFLLSKDFSAALTKAMRPGSIRRKNGKATWDLKNNATATFNTSAEPEPPPIRSLEECSTDCPARTARRGFWPD